LADDPLAFAEAVALLLKDAELRRRYGHAAAALAGKYDWAVIGDRFTRVLETMVGTGSRESFSEVESGCVTNVRGS